MMSFWRYLIDTRVLAFIGLALVLGVLFFGPSVVQVAVVYAAIVLAIIALISGLIWAVQKYRAYKHEKALEDAIQGEDDKDKKNSDKKEDGDIAVLRERMQGAVKTIKKSKLGHLTGRAALYELPWYMVIGNPAAGKSTAISQSNLNFPFKDSKEHSIQGVGGTRNCDWFFTTEGILLDTAGRYSVYEEDQEEWLGFLKLLKKHRSKAPINGIIIAVSISELLNTSPEQNIELAKSLRQKVQEVTERLEVLAPVYVMFTKMDLVSGFTEFFKDEDVANKEQVWGATLPYDEASTNSAAELFKVHFAKLKSGLKEKFLAFLTINRLRKVDPKVLTFPLEFATLEPLLQSFINTLFEENPYQYRPIFRGFYFTSATHEGSASSLATEQVINQYNLGKKEGIDEQVGDAVPQGYFLKDLFSQVIFKDKGLVKQYTNKKKNRIRFATFALSALLLGTVFTGWGVSYVSNRQFIQSVEEDLDKVINIQKDKVDIASRLDAMYLLQTRLEQVRAWNKERPISISLGLYQGEAVESKLAKEYFHGVSQLMLTPVSSALESYLQDVNRNATKLKPLVKPPTSGMQPLLSNTGISESIAQSRFQTASPDSVEDAYNALKTYLMLAEPEHRDAAHMTDQITRFWRNWLELNRGNTPHHEIIRNGERMITFSMANLNHEHFPQLENNFALVDEVRSNLRRVVRGVPARERVYADIKARASTRFAPVTVNNIVGKPDQTIIGGSYVVSGAFTKQAWGEFINKAFKDAASVELQSTDWVLKISSKDDLSVEGSPEQIRKVLTEMYKNEYVAEWKKFMQGITIKDFENFKTGVQNMNRIGDPATSPVRKVMQTLYDETSWDNPKLVNERLKETQEGVTEWVKRVVLRQAPSQVDVNLRLGDSDAEIKMGPIGKEFEGLAKLMNSRDGSETPFDAYMAEIAKVKAKLNQINGKGDKGPDIQKLLAETMGSNTSELSEALRYVDEQMLSAQTPAVKQTIRPLLVRPLIQSYDVLLTPAEVELNKLWAAQVYEPFQQNLANKYPFNPNSKLEATSQEIANVFGSKGAIAEFTKDKLGPFVIQRGSFVTPRQWADKGVNLSPEFVVNLPKWVAKDNNASSVNSTPRTVFQVLPSGAPQLLEYTLTIDGQVMRYRNTAPVWRNFFWPAPTQNPGVKISAVDLNNKKIDFFNEPGEFGLDKLFAAAEIKKLPNGANELSWTKDGITITNQIKVISQPDANSDQDNINASGSNRYKGMKLPELIAGPNLNKK